VLRILVVEDSNWRIDQFRKWAPADVRLVETRCGGRAIGTIRRSRRDDWAGIMLDHDLNEQAVSNAHGDVDGRAVVQAIVDSVDPATPILVHSMNSLGADSMKRALESAGFYVLRIRMVDLTQELFLDWLEDVRASQP
jgi:CheY-like chemotaxis protein